ncbi:alpha-hydroxy acid oxidase [Marinigracilibium pacificum]|uniref:Alpha-hydroxy-acid oxidizing protein n=1 Tax=Marinigracilibium pacificum TaxID=2729599 RepID=A0A848J213_9BACT|nr:alpha-hydroxy acid oxidase [Marinigracilibium pacificum]NMM48349.1 alpha-hydroxy-acid oxidizing protein [Marinigracilibium pacificum]
MNEYNRNYPDIPDLRLRASKRVPKFAFEYLDGGCNQDINLKKNMTDIQEIELMPKYIANFDFPDTSVELFGHRYDAPFGISPIGLQGLIWPKAPEILAKSALEHNVPFILSTVSTASIENIAEITEGRFWFQLYHPKDNKLRDDLLERAWESGCRVLVILADVPTFGYRPRDIRNGLSLPPKMTLKNVMQIVTKPTWALKTLSAGKPSFASINPYIPKNLNLSQLGNFMNYTFDGRLTMDKIKELRDKWKGKLVIKGLVNEEDIESSISIGIDGAIVSNHGGRQLDAGQSSIKPLQKLAPEFGDKITLMIDSGLRSGPDIARCIAAGAQFTFMGRPFMYGVGALGNEGGNHTIAILKTQFKQVMEQLCCENVADLPQHLIQ